MSSSWLRVFTTPGRCVSAHREAESLVQLVVLRRQKDHGHGAELADPAKQLHSVHMRHLDIEDAEIGLLVGESLQRRRRVGVDPGDETFRLKCDRDGSQDIAVVVDQRDLLIHAVIGGPASVIVDWLSTVPEWNKVARKRFDEATS